MVTDIQLEVSTSLDRPGSSLKDPVLLQEQLVRCPAELAPIESLHLKPHKKRHLCSSQSKKEVIPFNPGIRLIFITDITFSVKLDLVLNRCFTKFIKFRINPGNLPFNFDLFPVPPVEKSRRLSSTKLFFFILDMSAQETELGATLIGLNFGPELGELAQVWSSKFYFEHKK